MKNEWEWLGSRTAIIKDRKEKDQLRKHGRRKKGEGKNDYDKMSSKEKVYGEIIAGDKRQMEEAWQGPEVWTQK